MTNQSGGHEALSPLLAFEPRPRLRPGEPWLTDEAIARYFSVAPRTVRRWAAAGMPSRRFGGVRRFRVSEAERWHLEQESCS